MRKDHRSCFVAGVLAAVLVLSSAVAGCGPDGVDQPSAAPVAVEKPIAVAKPKAEARSDEPLSVDYPMEGTLFPPEIVAPTFRWSGPNEVDDWKVAVRNQEGEGIFEATIDAAQWRPSEEIWREIKRQAMDRDVDFAVTGGGSSAGVRFRVSPDEVGDSLFYREVPLPFLKAVQDPSRIRWRYGTVDLPEGPPIVLENLPVCGNCHSFADNGSVLGLDVDYGNDKGAYAILPVAKNMVMNDEKIITWADYRRDDGELTFGLLSRVSPDGRYVVSTVKDRSVFVPIPDLMISQLFFPIKGILVIYDRETGEYAPLPGADDPRYVQSNAVWSPDGKEILFARAKAHHAERLDQKNSALVDETDVPEFTVEKKPFRYDIYRIPFNGGKGGVAVPLEGAADNGMSNFFPKYSPDGKWIVFCKADSYMLLRPDSELYIVPAAGGAARRLRYNTARMNSWHSWSSNSRWLVFSSKVNGPYTQLFLTHIDEEGNDSPPVLLERFTSPDRAANIPEFVNLPGDAIASIREEFLDSYSFLRAGIANENTGDHKGAERAFRRGLEIAPNDVELLNALGWTLFQDGRSEEAVASYETALEVEPDHVKSHNNIALALVELGRLEAAAGHFEASLRIEPKPEIYSDLGFTLARLGRTEEAMEYYSKALELDPDCTSAHFNMAVTYVQAGAFPEAEAHYRKALPERPGAQTYNGLGYVLIQQGRFDEAAEALKKAIAAEPKFLPAYNNLADAYLRQGKLEDAAHYYRLSLEQRPSPGVYNALGNVLAKMGKQDEAARQFAKARAMTAAR